jgi:hypothetical protein
MQLSTRAGLWTFASVSVVWFLVQVVATKIGLVVDRWNGMFIRAGASWNELVSLLPVLLMRGLFTGLFVGLITTWAMRKNESKT